MNQNDIIIPTIETLHKENRKRPEKSHSVPLERKVKIKRGQRSQTPNHTKSRYSRSQTPNKTRRSQTPNQRRLSKEQSFAPGDKVFYHLAPFGSGDYSDRFTWLETPSSGKQQRVSHVRRSKTPDPGRYRTELVSDFKLTVPHKKSIHFGSRESRDTGKYLKAHGEGVDPGTYFNDEKYSSFLEKKSFRRVVKEVTLDEEMKKRRKYKIIEELKRDLTRREELGLPPKRHRRRRMKVLSMGNDSEEEISLSEQKTISDPKSSEKKKKSNDKSKKQSEKHRKSHKDKPNKRSEKQAQSEDKTHSDKHDRKSRRLDKRDTFKKDKHKKRSFYKRHTLKIRSDKLQQLTDRLYMDHFDNGIRSEKLKEDKRQSAKKDHRKSEKQQNIGNLSQNQAKGKSSAVEVPDQSKGKKRKKWRKNSQDVPNSPSDTVSNNPKFKKRPGSAKLLRRSGSFSNRSLRSLSERRRNSFRRSMSSPSSRTSWMFENVDLDISPSFYDTDRYYHLYNDVNAAPSMKSMGSPQRLSFSIPNIEDEAGYISPRSSFDLTPKRSPKKSKNKSHKSHRKSHNIDALFRARSPPSTIKRSQSVTEYMGHKVKY